MKHVMLWKNIFKKTICHGRYIIKGNPTINGTRWCQDDPLTRKHMMSVVFNVRCQTKSHIEKLDKKCSIYKEKLNFN